MNSTLEATVSMLESMSENELKEVQNYIRYIIYKNDEVSVYKPMSEAEIVEQLLQSVERSDKGYTKSAKEVSDEMRERYAI
jgi:hypothetical protein